MFLLARLLYKLALNSLFKGLFCYIFQILVVKFEEVTDHEVCSPDHGVLPLGQSSGELEIIL